jgi:hypothetical protein
MNIKTINLLVIIGLFLTACSYKGDIKGSISSSSKDPITTENVNREKVAAPTATAMNSRSIGPSLVNLVFKPIQMEQLTEGKPDNNWELIKEIPFGNVKQQKIVLNIYKEAKKPDDPTVYRHAVIRFQDKYFSINDFVSPDFSEIPANEHSTMYLLQRTFLDHDHQLVLLGGIELFANGPGRVAYIIYDSMKNKWFTFEDWGKPRFVDLDSDGIDEFVIQFEGLHLQFPDVTVYTWNKGIIEVSTSIKAAVLGSTVGSYAILGDDKKISVGENNAETSSDAQYIYDKGKLLKL